MRGIKTGTVFAVCGFLLSLIFGLFSHTSILSVLLKAILFALSFGVLGLIINFVFTKFLANESTNEFGSESNSEKNIYSNHSTTGNIVDITIQDEDLEKGGSDNHFVVNDNHQMLNDSDLESKKEENSVVSENENGFIPLKKIETLKSLTGKEAITPENAIINSTSENDMQFNGDEKLDVLPDMNNVNFESNNSTVPDDVETDDGFVSSGNYHKNNDDGAEIKDASLMAKAISSILSDEDS